MSRLTLRLIIATLTFTVGVLAVAGWYFWHRTPTRVSVSRVSVPAGWQKVEIDGLYLLVPADMKQQEVHGVDSEDFQFANEDTTLNIEYGINQWDFSSLADRPDYHEESVVIDGHPAKLRFCRYDSATDFGNAERPYITAIYFDKPSYNWFSLNLWAESKDATGQGVARQSFLTLKFKPFKN